MFCHTGESLGLQHIHSPTSEEIVSTAYDTITDHHLKKPYYAEVIIPSEVKMTPNPAYAVPWTITDSLVATITMCAHVHSNKINTCSAIFVIRMYLFGSVLNCVLLADFSRLM